MSGGTLTKSGSGSLTFTNTSNNFSTVSVSGGPLNGNGATTAALGISNYAQLGSGQITFSNTSSISALYVSATTAGSVANAIALSSSAVTTQFSGVSNSSRVVSLDGAITGGTANAILFFTNSASGGVGAYKLTNIGNTFTGTIQLDRGGLEFTSNAALGNASNAIKLDVGVATAGTGLRFGANNLVIAATHAVNITDNAVVDTQTFTGSEIAGTITISSGKSLSKLGSTNLLLSGTVAGTGGLTTTAGTLTLSNTANSYSGTTALNGGTLNVASLANGGVNSALGAGANTAGLLTFNGGTLQYTGATAQSTDRLFTINTSGGTLDASGSVATATVSFTNTGSLGGGSGATAQTFTLTGSNTGANTIAGKFVDSTTAGGAVTIRKTGAGTWNLSNPANAYTGGTTVLAGTLGLRDITTTSGTYGSIGTGALSTVAQTANSIISLGGNAGINATLANSLTLGTGFRTELNVLSGSISTARDVTVSGLISGGAAGAVRLYINTDTGNGSLGAVKLTNASNSFLGNIQVNRGGLAVTSDGAFGNAANSIVIDIGTATQVGLRFDAAMSSARAIALGGGKQVFNTNVNNVTLSGVISNLNAGAGELFKTGAGTLTLTNTSTFTGTTTVSGGTLEAGAAGALGATTGVVVNTGGTLLLSGSDPLDRINNTAAINLAGGTFNTAGLSETVGTLTLSVSSVIDFGAGTNSVRFADSSGLAWSGTTLSIHNWTDGSDHLFFGDGSGVGLQQSQLDKIKFYSDAGVTVLPYPPGYSGFTGSMGEVVPVPEPSTIFAACGMLGLIGMRERRKNKAVHRQQRAGVRTISNERAMPMSESVMDMQIRFAREGREPGAKPAQGNALGRSWRGTQSCKGEKTWAALLGLVRFLSDIPRALPWVGLFAHLRCSRRSSD